MDTQNYKRTLASSVGAGMGSLFNSSGRTYFILEHKVSSKYHQAGEAQKIIVDQIELGRDASCQVRFDESFETVSRKHAAIVREGENWKLINLSKSNPTLVNGKAINGTYYLQTGDEIQLSSGGPRLGFIVPQGRQALTSSIGLTERMNLFRKQALRPYKTALTILSIVFLVAIACLVYWNLNLDKKNEQLIATTEQQKEQLKSLDYQIDSLAAERNRLESVQQDLERKLREKDGDTDDLQRQLYNVTEELNHVNSIAYTAKNKMESLRKQIEEEAALEVEPTTPKSTSTSVSSIAISNSNSDSEPSSSNASSSLRDYYDHIYTIKIDRIDVEKDGISFDPGIQLSDIICGTGFMLNNGSFVTDRQNVQPWIYGDAQWKDDWRKLMAECVGAGCKVIIHYIAYSTKGTGKPLRFVNSDFKVDTSGDINTLEIEVRKELRTSFKRDGIDIAYVNKRYVKAKVLAPKSRQWAVIRGLGTSGDGLPFDSQASYNLPGGSEVHMVGYAGSSNIHNLVPAHFNDRTNIDDVENGTIIMQNTVNEHGYYGSPAFIKDSDGTYKVVGVMVGGVSGKDRIVPINKAL